MIFAAVNCGFGFFLAEQEADDDYLGVAYPASVRIHPKFSALLLFLGCYSSIFRVNKDYSFC